jgi:hypothetical protein
MDCKKSEVIVAGSTELTPHKKSSLITQEALSREDLY